MIQTLLLTAAMSSASMPATVGRGTAFVIEGGHIVTAEHVITNRKTCAWLKRQAKPCKVRPRASIELIRADGVTLRARVIKRDRLADVAILAVDHPDQLPDALPLAQGIEDGARVASAGFVRPSIYGRLLRFVRGELVKKRGFAGVDWQYTLALDVINGHSGGPAVNDAGELVAMLSAAKAGDVYATHAERIAAIVRGLPRRTVSATPAPGETIKGRVLLVRTESDERDEFKRSKKQ